MASQETVKLAEQALLFLSRWYKTAFDPDESRTSSQVPKITRSLWAELSPYLEDDNGFYLLVEDKATEKQARTIRQRLAEKVADGLDHDLHKRQLIEDLVRQTEDKNLFPLYRISSIVSSFEEPVIFTRFTRYRISGIPPFRSLDFESAERVNLFCGDNGIGKTFLLDGIWSLLHNAGDSLSIIPIENGQSPEIKAFGPATSKVNFIALQYKRETQQWERYGEFWVNNRFQVPISTGVPLSRTGPSASALYVKATNGFMLWDSLREDGLQLLDLNFERVWHGFEIRRGDKPLQLINGLIRDWVEWQYNPDTRMFDTLTRVLEKLSPPESSDIGKLIPGEAKRISLTDSRKIPTIQHSYGTVPITQASAGVQKILTLAYLIVWLWFNHEVNAQLSGKDPDRNLLIFFDEIESHLHPQWQRRILPALLEVGECLAPDVNIQFLITTHSPLVLASLEPHFDEERDKLFHLDLVHKNGSGSEVELKEQPFIKHGTADSWLTSETFELGSARSIEAETAIREAIKLQKQARPKKKDVLRIHEDLSNYLPKKDRFWVRWIAFAERHGVKA